MKRHTQFKRIVELSTPWRTERDEVEQLSTFFNMRFPLDLLHVDKFIKMAEIQFENTRT